MRLILDILLYPLPQGSLAYAVVNECAVNKVVLDPSELRRRLLDFHLRSLARARHHLCLRPSSGEHFNLHFYLCIEHGA